MQTRCNALAWNPVEAFNFTAANEDCNLYSYDMRKLSGATCVHKVRFAAAAAAVVEMA
jgi:WD repeat and SOF domain-containing protein 1